MIRTIAPVATLKIGALVCALGLSFSGCSAYQIKSQPENPVVLETNGENCRVVKEKSLYSLLFGAVPLNPVDEEELFPEQGVTYRITDEVTTLDTVVSVLAGWALSLNSRTITVEACEENVRVANPETERKELDRILAGIAQKSRAPVVILKDGRSYQGRIVEFSDSEVAIETAVRPDENGENDSDDAAGTADESDSGASDGENLDSDQPVSYVDVVELKNGQIKAGKVVSQNRERIVLRSGTGSAEYLKKDIQRVRYRVPEKELKAQLEPEKEVVRIPREDIRKIVVLP